MEQSTWKNCGSLCKYLKEDWIGAGDNMTWNRGVVNSRPIANQWTETSTSDTEDGAPDDLDT